MEMTQKISSNLELKQSIFTRLRTMANESLTLAGYDGYTAYPWEAIDFLQAEIAAAHKGGDATLQGNLSHCITIVREWRNALVELGNTANIPDESENNWFDPYQ